MPAPSNPSASVMAGDVKFANDAPLAFIAGPCAMESKAHALETAAALKEIATRLGVGLVYKTSFDKANRTGIDSPRGVGMKQALQVFADIRAQTGLPVLTDVHEASQCAPVGEVVDVLQIPAFLSRQTDLLIAAAKTGKVVNIKKGQFMAPPDMQHALGKVLQAGNDNLLLTERGVSFGYHRLVCDMTGLPVLRATGAPVIFDATHSVQRPSGEGGRSGGERRMAPVLARAAVAVRVAGVFMETHPNPDEAPSDGPNMIPLAMLEKVMRDLLAIDKLIKSIPLPEALLGEN